MEKIKEIKGKEGKGIMGKVGIRMVKGLVLFSIRGKIVNLILR